MANVLVPLAQGCEELEAVTVIDLLRRAGITVDTAGLDAQPVRASRGTVLLPDITLDEALTLSKPPKPYRSSPPEMRHPQSA